MSNTEAKAWTSSPGRAKVAAEGCRHAIKIDCGICHAEEFERDMNMKASKYELATRQTLLGLADQRDRYKKARWKRFREGATRELATGMISCISWMIYQKRR